MSVLPTPSISSPSTIQGCRLVSVDDRVLPLESVALSVDARGGLGSVVVRQTFHNPHDEPLTATYQLPLPADGAVTGFAFTLDDRRIVGEIDKKASARQRFEDAVLEGRTAALLEQTRSNLFEQQIGNIPPHSTLVAEVTVEQPLAWENGQWCWRFPTTVAPRFLGAQTPDPEAVRIDVADGPTGIRLDVSLQIRDERTGPAVSDSHDLSADSDALTGGLDRDVVVRWPVATPETGVSLEVAEGPEGWCGGLTVVPPLPEHASEAVPRDLILLIDTSGSMGGRPLEQARAFLAALVKGLSPADRLEMIEFSSRPSRWQPKPVSMDPGNVAAATAWLHGLRASGGTHMHEAIIEALTPLRANAHRQVVLVTDGLIGFERDIIGAIKNRLPTVSRVHTIGVGSSTNRALLYPAARAGGGMDCILGLDDDPTPVVHRLLKRTGAPLVVDLKLSGDALADYAPARLPDLFAGHPCRFALRLKPGSLTLRGRSADGPWVQQIQVAEAGGRPVIVTRFAREKVEDLEVAAAAGEAVDERIEALGLAYQIATRMTSWIATTDEATVDPSAPHRETRVPHELPHGMSAEGVGLRGIRTVTRSPALSTGSVPRRRTRGNRRRDASAAPPAPKAKLEAERKERKAASPMDNLRGAIDSLFGRTAPSPEPEPAEEAPRTQSLDEEELDVRGGEGARQSVRATVKKHDADTLIVEFTLPVTTEWTPSRNWVVWADGRRAMCVLLPATTRAGTVVAGLVVRLAVKMPHTDRPVRIEVGTLVLEL